MSPTQSPDGEQLTLLTAGARRRPAASHGPATQDPIALVAVDTGLAHLDRPFDYVVPAELDEQVRPGVRVKVRFAGRDHDGFVLDRVAHSGHEGRLAPLRRVVSPEPVLTPAVLQTARGVAAWYAGTLTDVLRLAVPPRHAAAERALPMPGGNLAPLAPPVPTAWEPYAAAEPFLRRLAAGEGPAGALAAMPTTNPSRDWPALLAQAAGTALAAGRGALLVVPDARDVARADAALTDLLGPHRHVRLTADQGPQARYTAFLKVLRGHVKVVVGTRAAAFAPVQNLGLVACWDDGDDSLIEPRAPYPATREVLRMRAHNEGAAILVAGFARSVAVSSWVQAGQIQEIAAPRRHLRGAVARIVVAGDDVEVARDAAARSARLPAAAFTVARPALERGPVLVQVPRRGYVPALACDQCRQTARCGVCSGPLAVASHGGPVGCRWCGAVAVDWRCPHCGGARLRSRAVGARRTAEEMGRAFPQVPVLTSGGAHVVDTVDALPRLVIATPGAEPVAEGGYAAALLLDSWALLDRPELDAGEETLRRWLAAVALVRGADQGGQVVLAGAPTHVVLPVIQALVRWDPTGFAARELDERAALRLPPAVRMAALTGTREALTSARDSGVWPAGAHVLGPLPVDADHERVLVTTDGDEGEALARAAKAVRARSVARREAEPVHVRMDPRDPTR
ncbi:MAG: primosomal protein N' [Phycicoccus sp.]|nr:primosomal protein N' [Phycicoccus sp.]